MTHTTIPQTPGEAFPFIFPNGRCARGPDATDPRESGLAPTGTAAALHRPDNCRWPTPSNQGRAGLTWLLQTDGTCETLDLCCKCPFPAYIVRDGAVNLERDDVAVPKVDDLMLPLLKALGDGKPCTLREAAERAYDVLGIPPAARTAVMPRKKTTFVWDRINWAKHYLKRARLLEAPARGLVRITAQGSAVLGKRPERIDKKYLEQFPEFSNRADPEASLPGVPTAKDIMQPLLEALKDGKSCTLREAAERAYEILDLSHDARTASMPGRNRPAIYSRMRWARNYLKRKRLLELPGHGLVRITAQGSAVLREGPATLDKKRMPGLESAAGADPGVLPADDDASETPEEAMRRGLGGMRGQLYQELKEELEKMSPAGFENLVLDLCKKMGYGDLTRHTGESGDRGIDGIIREDRLGLGEIYIQAKKWAPTVRAKDVRDFVGALAATSTKKGIFITTSSFTAGARDAVEGLKDGTRVILMDGDQLVELMDECGVGVVRAEDIAINRVDGEYFTQFG